MKLSERYIITEPIEVIAVHGDVQTEINMVSHDGKPPLIDIRVWQRDPHEPMMGLYFYDDEFEKLREIMNEITLDPDKARIE